VEVEISVSEYVTVRMLVVVAAAAVKDPVTVTVLVACYYRQPVMSKTSPGINILWQ